MRTDATFIGIEVDDEAAGDATLAARLAEAGITVAEDIASIPDIMKSKIAERSPA